MFPGATLVSLFLIGFEAHLMGGNTCPGTCEVDQSPTVKEVAGPTGGLTVAAAFQMFVFPHSLPRLLLQILITGHSTETK